MAVLANPDEIRALARTARTMARDVESTGTRVASGAGIQWVGLAAERYRERLAEQGRSIREVHEHLVAAAKALDELADTYEERAAAVRRAASFVGDVLDDARRTVSRLGSVAADGLSDVEHAALSTARGVLAKVPDVLPGDGAPEWMGLAKVFGR